MEKGNKKKIIIGVTSLFLVIILIIGLTYAYYRTRIIGNNSEEPSITITSKKLEIVYSDNQSTFIANKVRPGYNNEEEPKEFTITNTGDKAVTYKVLIDNVVNGFDKGVEGEAKREPYNDWTYELIKKDTRALVASGEINSNIEQTIYESVTINSKEVQTYELIIRYKNLEDIDQSDDMDQELSFRINIEEDIYYSNTDLIPVKWEDATEGTLVYALKNNQPNGTSTTTPGKSASLKTEARILETEDDYGNSYVYRGRVDNNYVNYAGMCWRVVRVQGDGSIKLILASELECDTLEDTAISGFATDGEKGVVGENYYDSMSGKKEGNHYLYNYKATGLEKWINKKITLEEQKSLKKEKWCLGDTTYAYQNGKKIGTREEALLNVQNPEYSFDYEASYRIGYLKSPSLICDATTNEGFNENIIGLLSVDEAVYAGAYDDQNYEIDTIDSHYLYDNAENGLWWLLTIKDFYYYEDDLDEDFVYMISNGDLISDGVGQGGNDRPVVVLKSGIKATYQKNDDANIPGTITNPYVIN